MSKLADEAKKEADDLARKAEGAGHKVVEDAPGAWAKWQDLVGERRAIPCAAICAIVLCGLLLTMCA